MLVLFSLLALGARSEDSCYGKKLMDHYKCQEHGEDEGMCDPGKGKACAFGEDPVKKAEDEYRTCAKEPGKKCETTSDCNQDCSTGQMCLDMGFMKSCAACADMGIKADCDAGQKAGLMCVWSPGDGDDGMCIASDDDCLGLKKGACKKMADKCDYMGKKCMRNYEPQCVGNRVDVHHKCHKMKTKADCASVKQPPFMKALCTWGKNTHDMEEGVMKCLKEKGISSPMKCETNDDCMCGQQCFEMFGMKSCSSCRDMGIKEDCDAMTNDNIKCKFVGDDSEGLCIQVDPCRDFSLDENQCKAERNKTCMFKDDKCFSMKGDKKSCKGRGKDKGAEMAARGMECEALKGCKWSQKGKGEKVKGKCKFSKKN